MSQKTRLSRAESRALSKRLYNLRQEGKTISQIAEAERLSYAMVQKRIERYENKRKRQKAKEQLIAPEHSYSENDSGATVKTLSDDPDIKRVIQQLGLDESLWDTFRVKYKEFQGYRKNLFKDLTFENGKITGSIADEGELTVENLHSLEIQFKRKDSAPVEHAIQEHIKDLKTAAPEYKLPKPLRETGDYLAVVCIFDAHFNKLAEDHTLTIEKQAEEFVGAVEAAIAKCLSRGLPIEEILFPVGQDALHSDNLKGTTTKGTWLESSSSMGRAIKIMLQAHITAIEHLAHLAPVRVITVPGNHDSYSTIWLGQVLEAQFSKHQSVTVDAEDKPRKYYRYGKTLLGVTHGDKTKPAQLAGLMALEAKAEWGKANYYEYLTGHYHTEKTMLNPLHMHQGVVIRVLPSLSGTDRWHNGRGYIGNPRAAELILYGKDAGRSEIFPIFIDELEKVTT